MNVRDKWKLVFWERRRLIDELKQFLNDKGFDIWLNTGTDREIEDVEFMINNHYDRLDIDEKDERVDLLMITWTINQLNKCKESRGKKTKYLYDLMGLLEKSIGRLFTMTPSVKLVDKYSERLRFAYIKSIEEKSNRFKGNSKKETSEILLHFLSIIKRYNSEEVRKYMFDWDWMIWFKESIKSFIDGKSYYIQTISGELHLENQMPKILENLLNKIIYQVNNFMDQVSLMDKLYDELISNLGLNCINNKIM